MGQTWACVRAEKPRLFVNPFTDKLTSSIPVIICHTDRYDYAEKHCKYYDVPVDFPTCLACEMKEDISLNWGDDNKRRLRLVPNDGLEDAWVAMRGGGPKR